MPEEYFVRYQGKCYDVGTRLKFRPGIGIDPLEGTIEWIVIFSVDRIYCSR